MTIFHHFSVTASAFSLFLLTTSAHAHFGAIIPSDNIISQGDSQQVELAVQFLHPFTQEFMEMAAPKRFGVLHQGKKTDLLPTLQAVARKGPQQEQQVTSWQASYQIKRPGDYTFFVEPAPYWEPAEDSYIIHYTKVCVQALGREEGWDDAVGLPTEIIPLTRPYGLWTGNLFTGQVLVGGKPLARAEVEVEYLNAAADNPAPVSAPSDPFVTQVIKADRNGVYSYAMPRAGWWGFAALSTAKQKIKHEGKEKDVEIGAVYWVHTADMR